MLNHKKFLEDNSDVFLYSFNMKIDFPFIHGFRKYHQEVSKMLIQQDFIQHLCSRNYVLSN